MTTAKTWAFYYIEKNSGIEHVIGTYDCKKPSRTNIYKELVKMWNNDTNIIGYGYTTQLDRIWLQWPQSKLK